MAEKGGHFWQDAVKDRDERAGWQEGFKNQVVCRRSSVEGMIWAQADNDKGF